LHFVLVSV